jgi:chromosome segregation ATPase
MEHPKRNKVQNVSGMLSVCENQPGVDTRAFVGLLDEILAYKEELKDAKERIEKNRENIKTLFLADNILAKRLAKAENLIQDLDRKHSEATQSLRADLNSTDGQVRTMKTARDDIINALTKVVNNCIVP